MSDPALTDSAAPTSHTAQAIILVVMMAGVFGYLLYRSLKKSAEPLYLIARWVITVPLVWFIVTRILPEAAKGGFAAIGALMQGLICGAVLTIVWRHSLAGIVAKPFGSLYDGGDEEAPPRPFYSVAQAKRKRGRYDEAMQEIRGQLEKFPNDFDGQLMLAEIQAENLHDLASAATTIQRLVQQPGHPPRSVAFALNSLADWHLKYHQDRDAAREALEQIIARLPDSEMAALAAQRIGHLASTEHLLVHHDRKSIALKEATDIGVVGRQTRPQAPAEVDSAQQADEYVKHLETHPLDTDVREKLAVLYADHYHRLDLAAEQIEQLIAHGGQPQKRVVRWLNVLADLQIRHGADYETVRQTVQRIIDLYPDASSAETARSRLSTLKLELKGKLSGPTVKMGTYEQDIGLKRGAPKPPS